jgi:hypothetical protein
VLVIAGERDTMAPLAGIAPAVASSGRAILSRHPGGHFHCFHGLGFEHAVTEQLAFLRDQLALESLPSADGDAGMEPERERFSPPTA